jgi:ribonuclease PH
MKRIDGRAEDELRPLRIHVDYLSYAAGSVLIELGNTRVLCAVNFEDRVPNFLRGEQSGWVTAEYAMLPSSTHVRTPRAAPERAGGRSQEIQRLIGRSIRAVVDLPSLGERTFTIDCDVIQADGGTRTAAITGAYVALYQALYRLKKKGMLRSIPLKSAVAATSVGIVNREELLDLCYQEDFAASVDFNVVMTDKQEFVEVQGTAEGKPFSKSKMESLLLLAEKGITKLFDAQNLAISSIG